MPTVEEIRKCAEKYNKEREEFNKKLEESRLKRLKEAGVEIFDKTQVPKEYCDHPNTMENSTATVLWIVVMLVGSIFKGNWAVWIVATVIWAKFITRHNR